MSAFNFKLEISLLLFIRYFFRFIKNTNKTIVGKKRRNYLPNNPIFYLIKWDLVFVCTYAENILSLSFSAFFHTNRRTNNCRKNFAFWWIYIFEHDFTILRKCLSVRLIVFMCVCDKNFVTGVTQKLMKRFL